MGLSSSKSSTKPVYEQQITDAANEVSSVFRQNQPRVQQTAETLGSLVPGMIEKYQAGDAGIDAARDYNSGVLRGDYLEGNPHLDKMVAQTSDNLADSIEARLARSGLAPNGSTYQDIVSKALAEQELGMRYNDYNAERSRMATAAGQAPSIAAGDVIQIAPLLETATTSSTLPFSTSSQYGALIGGLLGPYTNTKQSGNVFQSLLGGAANAAAAYFGAKG